MEKGVGGGKKKGRGTTISIDTRVTEKGMEWNNSRKVTTLERGGYSVRRRSRVRKGGGKREEREKKAPG